MNIIGFVANVTWTLDDLDWEEILNGLDAIELTNYGPKNGYQTIHF